MIQEISELIRSTRGRFFKVSFLKRTNGERREMVARLGVTKHLRGGGLSFEPKDHDLQIVFDVQKKAYRSIPLDAITWFKCGQTAWRKA